MTEDERRHVEKVLMPDAERAKSVEDLEHPLEEHFRYARLYIEDTRKQMNRLRWMTALWLLTWAVLITLSVYGVVRLVDSPSSRSSAGTPSP